MYFVSILIIFFVLLNWFLGAKLYNKPSDKSYLNNVGIIDLSKEKNICAMPRYVFIISILVGILLGGYIALAINSYINSYLALFVILLICICYLIEITRSITIKDNKIILSKIFSKQIILDANSINGIYLYSFNKKFLEKHAYTTKLIINTKDGKIHKFCLSSLNNKAVLNMIKENFGVSNYKMFIGNEIEKI